MSLSTHSKFYFDYNVSASNLALDFDEGGSELQATLKVGSYTPTTLATEVARALNEAGALTYTVTFNRSTRIYTIAATGNFTLRVATGTRLGTTAYTLLGFTGANRTGAASYDGDTATGQVYTTQFILQSYISSEDSRKAAEAVVNKSASGRVEVVSFGEERFVKFNIKYVTDRAQPAGGPIRENLSGVSKLRTFMRFITTKAPFEFMPDENTPATFEKLILESTPLESKGTGYELKELYDQGLPGFYETGVLKCRVDLS